MDKEYKVKKVFYKELGLDTPENLLKKGAKIKKILGLEKIQGAFNSAQVQEDLKRVYDREVKSIFDIHSAGVFGWAAAKVYRKLIHDHLMNQSKITNLKRFKLYVNLEYFVVHHG